MSEIEIPSTYPDWLQNHLKVYAEDPERGHMWKQESYAGVEYSTCLLLTTTGRKSGKPRTLPLIYQKADEGYIIIGSKGGDPKDPSWVVNLKANPKCKIQVAHDKFDVVARISEGAEREKLWKMMSSYFPPYLEYQKKTDRPIPVVVLEVQG